MERMTRKQIQAQCDNLNRLLGLPMEPYTSHIEDKGYMASRTSRANIGNIHLDHNIGGYAIHQMVNDGGGVTCPMGDYRLTAWECWHALRVACGAVQLAQERAKLQEAA